MKILNLQIVFGLLVALLLFTNCKKTVNKEFELTEFTNDKGFCYGNNKFQKGELNHNGFKLKIKNNSGVDITKAYIGANISIHIAELEWVMTSYDRQIKKREISEDNPWKNGEELEVTIFGFQGIETSKSKITNYDIKGSTIEVKGWVRNDMLKYENYFLEGPIAVIDITQDLINLKMEI